MNPGTSCPPTHKCASCKCRYACCCFLCCSQEWFIFLEIFATHFGKHEKHGQVWPYCASSLFANLRNAPGVWSNISGQAIDSMLIACVECPYKGHATAIWCKLWHLGDAFKTVPFVRCDGYCGLLKRLSLECIAALLQNGVWNCHQCLLTVGWYTVYDSFEIAVCLAAGVCEAASVERDCMICSVKPSGGTLASCHCTFVIGSWFCSLLKIETSCRCVELIWIRWLLELIWIRWLLLCP